MIATTTSSATPLPNIARRTVRTEALGFAKRLFRYRQAQIAGFIILVLVLAAIFAPLIAPYAPDAIGAGRPLTPPNRHYIFGTDDLGRDMFSRMLYGARITLRIGAIIVAVELVIGVTIGLVSGYFGGWVDMILMRFTDVMLAFPGIMLALAIVSTLGPGLTNAIFAVALGAWPVFARVVRSSVLTVRESEYVLAGRVLGATNMHMMVRGILPNVIAPIIVLASLEFPAAVLVAAALSFLGLGAQPPAPEWGALLTDARNYIRSAPYLINIPGLAIFCTVLAFNLLGNALRDVLDPRLRQR
ncbi:MAG TPA: ABC transporter permease [Thermomicrobiales bacterium]|nr:ABC transporter permease [Thermomicrobiales bacterium]